MRRTLSLVLAALVLVGTSGCGGNDSAQTLSTDYAAVLRGTADKTAKAGSSKMTLLSVTKVSGQNVTLNGSGAFDYAAQTGNFTMKIGGINGSAPITMRQIITGGSLYLEVPGQPGFYEVALKDVAGTSLSQSSDPTASLQTLAGVSDDVTKVGSEDVRGTSTTHYRGTIDVQKAIDMLEGSAKDIAKASLGKLGVTTLPFDAYIDKQGRMRRMVQTLSVTTQGQQVDSTTTIELYDFGTKVKVQAPPASQVKDGTALLEAFKGAAG